MAPLHRSQASKRVINVSQDAVSSPDFAAMRGDPPDGSFEIVEDSFKVKAQLPDDLADEPTPQTDQEDGGDLYPVVPVAVVNQKLQKSLSKKGPLFASLNRPGTLSSTSKPVPTEAVGKPHVQHCLTTHSLLADQQEDSDPAQGSRRVAGFQRSTASENVNQRSSTSTTASKLKHSPQASQSKPTSTKPIARPKQSQIKAQASGAKSSLAALKAKRTSGSSAPVVPDAVDESETQESHQVTRRNENNPKSGETLPLNRHATSSKRAAPSSNTPASLHGEPLSISRKQKCSVQASSGRPPPVEDQAEESQRSTGGLKRCAPAASPVPSESGDVFDIPTSPHVPGTLRPTKKSRINAASTSSAAVRSDTRKASKSATENAKAKAEVNTKSKTSAGKSAPITSQPRTSNRQPKATPKSTASTDNPPNVRTRRMAKLQATESNASTNVGSVNAESKSDPSSNKEEASSRKSALRKPKGKMAIDNVKDVNDSMSQGDEKQANTIVTNSPDIVRAVGMPSHSTNLRGDRKTSAKAVAVASNPDRQLSGMDLLRGASQAEAIVISDQASSSSLDSETESPPRKPGRTVEPPAIKFVRKQPMDPRTPLKMPSSPPIKQVAAGRRSSHGSSVAQRSTIISFGQSGPLNQGHASSRRTALASVSTNLTSMQPATRSSKVKAFHTDADYERQNGESRVPDSLRYSKTNRIAEGNVSDSVEDALADFGVQRKPIPASHTGDLALSKARPQKKAPAEPIIQSVQDDGFAMIDDFDQEPLANQSPSPESKLLKKPMPQRLESQIAMPPPPAPRLPKLATTQHESSTSSAESGMSRIVTDQVTMPIQDTAVKRPPESESERARPAKRTKLEPAAQDLETRDKPIETKHQQDQADNVQNSLQDVVERMATSLYQHARHKSKRKSSHNSQKVDQLGSPIPPDMTVPEHSTALGTYSQHVASSPAHALTELREVRDGKHVREQPLLPPRDVLAPTSFQPSIISSNRKQQPAAPQEKSSIFTRLVTTASNAPLISGVSALPITDPFELSAGFQQQQNEGGSRSSFMERLKLASHQSRNDRAQPMPSSAFRAKPQQQPKKGKQHLTKSPTYSSPPSSPSSSETSTETEHSVDEFEDLRIWRNALRPHQVNLFDELVNISHRLVQHLVDRETAATQIIDHYIQRGSRLVDVMEVDHAEEREKLAKKLMQHKTELQTALGECEKRVLKGAAAVEREGYVSDGAGSDNKTVEEGLKRILDEFC